MADEAVLRIILEDGGGAVSIQPHSTSGAYNPGGTGGALESTTSAASSLSSVQGGLIPSITRLTQSIDRLNSYISSYLSPMASTVAAVAKQQAQQQQAVPTTTSQASKPQPAPEPASSDKSVLGKMFGWMFGAGQSKGSSPNPPHMAAGGSVGSTGSAVVGEGGRPELVTATPGGGFTVTPTERAENFAKWFGESTVRTESGQPKTMFHGTRATKPFTAFDFFKSRDFGIHFGELKAAQNILGPEETPDTFNQFSRMFQVHLKAEKPLRLPDLGDWDWKKMVTALGHAGVKVKDKFLSIEKKMLEGVGNYQIKPSGYTRATQAMLRKTIEDAGYDSIVYTNAVEGVDSKALLKEARELYGQDVVKSMESGWNFPEELLKKHGGTESYIMLRPTQIKSATANVGTYNKAIADIGMAQGGIVKPIDNREKLDLIEKYKEEQEYEKLMEGFEPIDVKMARLYEEYPRTVKLAHGGIVKPNDERFTASARNAQLDMGPTDWGEELLSNYEEQIIPKIAQLLPQNLGLPEGVDLPKAIPVSEQQLLPPSTPYHIEKESLFGTQFDPRLIQSWLKNVKTDFGVDLTRGLEDLRLATAAGMKELVGGSGGAVFYRTTGSAVLGVGDKDDESKVKKMLVHELIHNLDYQAGRYFGGAEANYLTEGKNNPLRGFADLHRTLVIEPLIKKYPNSSFAKNTQYWRSARENLAYGLEHYLSKTEPEKAFMVEPEARQQLDNYFNSRVLPFMRTITSNKVSDMPINREINQLNKLNKFAPNLIPLPKLAHGGTISSDGSAIVGEAGKPELVEAIPGGGFQVTPLDDSQARAKLMSGMPGFARGGRMRKHRRRVHRIRSAFGVAHGATQVITSPIQAPSATIGAAGSAVSEMGAISPGGLGLGMVALGEGMKVLSGIMENFNQTATKYAEYNPAIAQAQAQAEITQVMNDMRRANQSAPEMVRLIRAQSEAQQQFEEAKLQLGLKLMPLVTGILKAVNSLANIINFWDQDKKTEDVEDPIETILNKQLIQEAREGSTKGADLSDKLIRPDAGL